MYKFFFTILFLSIPNISIAAISAVTATSTTGTGTGANVTINSPVGTTTGDVLVCVIVEKDTVGDVTSVANGGTAFTQLGFFNGGTANSLTVWYRVVQPGDPTSWTITTTVGIAANMMAYRGVDNNNPIDSQGTANGNTSTTGTMNAVTTVAANAWYIGTVGCSNATATVTATSLTNQRGDVANGGNASTKMENFMGDTIIAAPGSSGTFTTTQTSCVWSSYAFALTPAAAGAANITSTVINQAVLNQWKSN